MSLPEIIPSNLPQFIQNKDRTSFANSVIPSGSVMLFAESDGNGGSKLIAKNPDGSFSEVGGGSSMNFYKCKSVNTSNHTWQGYLASVDSTTGVWSFASTATSGLTYDHLTPQTGKVYDQDCTFLVSGYKTGLPEDGLLFYLPLDEDPGDTDATGKSLTKNNMGSASYTILSGIPCAGLPGNSAIIGPEFSSVLPNDSSARFTVSCWMYAPITEGYKKLLSGFPTLRNGSYNILTGITEEDGYTSIYSSGVQSYWSNSSSSLNHYVLTYNGSELILYKNKVLVGTMATGTPFINPGASYSTYNPGFFNDSNEVTYLAALRIYNRVLTSSEIDALANEF